IIVPDFFKEKTGCRGSPGGHVQFLITPAIDQLREIGNRDFTGSHFHECSYDSADHPPEEVRSSNSELNNVVFQFDISTNNLNNGRFMRPRCIGGTETNEIVTAHKH